MKKLEVKTKRMVLRPMTDAEIEMLMERLDSDELRAAYGEMLDDCKRDPANRVWYAPNRAPAAMGRKLSAAMVS